MGKGYAEGPAAEARFEALERGEEGVVALEPPERPAVYGSTVLYPSDPNQTAG